MTTTTASSPSDGMSHVVEAQLCISTDTLDTSLRRILFCTCSRRDLISSTTRATVLTTSTMHKPVKYRSVTSLLVQYPTGTKGYLGYNRDITHRPLSSSILGLPLRILNINHKQELLRGLWVTFRTQKRFKGTLLYYQYQASSCLNHSRATAKLASIRAKTLAANAEPSMRFRWMSSYLHRGTFRQLGVPYFGGPDNKDPII